ncbi:MAG: neutral/alkaline non-lysosomal ceramidase N-terminal domain-containing protein [Myxococcota bacterium]
MERHILDVNESTFGSSEGPDALTAWFGTVERDQKTLLIWLHGGLVGRQQGIDLADRVGTVLLDDAVAALFVVWRSSLGETLSKDLDDVLRSRLFERLRGLASRAHQRRNTRARMPAGAEQAAIEADIRSDPELEPLLRQPSADSQAAPVSRVRAIGPGWVARLARAVIEVVFAVVERTRSEPSRPLGATLVEELLRTLYVDLVGAEIWAQMKNDTAEACAPGAPMDRLLDEIAEWWKADESRRVVLVGHSAGAVFVCHVLQAAARKPLPAGLAFEVVWLAAAATFELFADTLRMPGVVDRVRRMRTFGLSDALERGYFEVPLYPASLLYLVSGLFEAQTDMPLVGMERYWDREQYPDLGWPHLDQVRDWAADTGTQAFWSRGPGLDGAAGTLSGATRHGWFGEDPETLETIRFLARDADWRDDGRARRPVGAAEAWQTAPSSRPVERRAATAASGTGAFRAAVTQVDLTPELFRSNTGYGATQARRARGWYGRLRATLALLEAPGGERVLLAATDLHVGSRFLAEALGRQLASIGVTVDRVFLGATHTHSGPAGLYGVPFYDWIAGEVVTGLFEGFDVNGTLALVDAMEAAARTLPARLVPAWIGYGEGKGWGNLWNRSLVPFIANDVEPWTVRDRFPKQVATWAGQAWNADEAQVTALEAAYPGRGAVDPRLRVLWLLQKADGAPLGGFGWLPATPTLIPYAAALFSSDVAGAAAREVERIRDVPFGIFGGALGDTNPVPKDVSLAVLREERDQNGRTDDEHRRGVTEIVRRIGRELASGYDAGITSAVAAAHAPAHLTVRFTEPVVPGKAVAVTVPSHLGPGPVEGMDRVATTWLPGESVTVASELNRDPDDDKAERSDRTTGPWLQAIDWADPHGPKLPHANVNIGPISLKIQFKLLEAITGLGKIGFDPWAPLRIVSIGDDVHLVGVPVEPSVRWARELEDALSGMGGQRLVTANCGGYLGYASTLAEYVVQDYEGSSVYWGRAFSSLLRTELVALSQNGETPPPTGKAWFVRTEVALEDQEPADDTRDALPTAPFFRRVRPVTTLADAGDTHFLGSFKPTERPHRRRGQTRGTPLPGATALVSLQVREPGGPWRSLGWDDRTGEIALWFDRNRWRISVQVPSALVAGKEVRFRIRDPQMQPADPDDPRLVAAGS